MAGGRDGTSYGTPALKVRNKLLVRLKEDGETLVMPGVPNEERDMLIAHAPTLYSFTDHYRDYPIVLIALPVATLTDVEPLLRRQWHALASGKARLASAIAPLPKRSPACGPAA